jgi:hypothetical protein
MNESRVQQAMVYLPAPGLQHTLIPKYCTSPARLASLQSCKCGSWHFVQIMMEGEEEEGQSAGTVGAGQSRDMGSLTGWQALANEVMAELGSGPQPGASQDQASAKGYKDEEEEMQVATVTTAGGALLWFS